MEILECTGIKSLGITSEACKRYQVPQVKTPTGIKLAAIFSVDCYKLLSLSGGYTWVNSSGYQGEYDPNLGLFGQHAVAPGKPVIIVPTELEALKLASLGYDAVCLAEPKNTDTLTYSILEENFIGITQEIWVWSASSFNKRKRSLENFLLYLAGTQRFQIKTIVGSDTAPILGAQDKTLLKVLLEVNQQKEWKPAGIVFTEELLNTADKLEPIKGIPTGFKCIDETLGGARPGEVTCITAGSGVGKSTLLQEIAYHIGVKEGAKCGMVFLEEKPLRTALRLASIQFNVRVDKLRQDPTLLTQKQWAEVQKPGSPIQRNFVFHNHFGSLDSDELFAKIDYMIDHCGVKFIFLDHISIAISGISSKEGERKDIDILMTKLTTRAVSKDVAFWIISHLSVPEGAPHEEGGRVTLSQLRGSGSIKQLSFNILAQERNQQDPDSTHALLRSLKCRETGVTGPIGVLHYDTHTGRLQEDFTWSPAEFEQMISPKGRRGGRGQQMQKSVTPQFGKTRFVDEY